MKTKIFLAYTLIALLSVNLVTATEVAPAAEIAIPVITLTGHTVQINTAAF